MYVLYIYVCMYPLTVTLLTLIASQLGFVEIQFSGVYRTPKGSAAHKGKNTTPKQSQIRQPEGNSAEKQYYKRSEL